MSGRVGSAWWLYARRGGAHRAPKHINGDEPGLANLSGLSFADAGPSRRTMNVEVPLTFAQIDLNLDRIVVAIVIARTAD